MKPYFAALSASLILHLLLFWLPGQTPKEPKPEIIKLGVQLDYSELASRRQMTQATTSSLAQPTKVPEVQARPEVAETAKPLIPKPLPLALTNTPTEPVKAIPGAKVHTRTATLPPKPVKTSVRDTPIRDRTLASPEQAADSQTEQPEEIPDKAVQPVAARSEQIPATEHTGEEAPILSPPRFQLGSLNNPKPGYPALARTRGWEGDVVIGVHVSEEGEIKHLEIMKSSHFGPLDHAAWETVKNEWTFEPATENGKRVPAFVEVPISFRLNPNK